MWRVNEEGKWEVANVLIYRSKAGDILTCHDSLQLRVTRGEVHWSARRVARVGSHACGDGLIVQSNRWYLGCSTCALLKRAVETHQPRSRLLCHFGTSHSRGDPADLDCGVVNNGGDDCQGYIS